MTNNEAGTPLWSDARIIEVLNGAKMNDVFTVAAMGWVRDEYEAKIAELEAARAADALRIAELEDQLAMAAGWIQVLNDLVDEGEDDDDE